MSNIDYEAALNALWSQRQTVIDGGDVYGELNIFFDGETVTLEHDGQFIWMSPAVLRAAVDWVDKQVTHRKTFQGGTFST